MRSPANKVVRPTSPQLYRHSTTPAGERPLRGATRHNAVTHGRWCRDAVIPGDDPVDFAHLRRGLFEEYQPRTSDEAYCVETIANLRWRLARWRRWMDPLDVEVGALAVGDPQGRAGVINEPDLHVWVHRAMDLGVHEGRLERLLCRTRDKLLHLQWARRKHLISGAIDPPPPEAFYPPLPPQAAANSTAPQAVADSAAPASQAPAATPSSDGGSANNAKQGAPPRPLSRQQRRAAQRALHREQRAHHPDDQAAPRAGQDNPAPIS